MGSSHGAVKKPMKVPEIVEDAAEGYAEEKDGDNHDLIYAMSPWFDDFKNKNYNGTELLVKYWYIDTKGG
jgi:hypothetical protein